MEITESHLNNRICRHCGVKTSTVTPCFYYVFTIPLSCNINIPSFIGNLWRVLLLGNHLKPSEGKQALKTINLDRQVYSRLLVVFKDRYIDLGKVQSYELASIPLALANMDGSLRQPSKSSLLKELEMDSLA